MKRFTYILFFIFLNLFQQYIFAQNQVVDSLKLALKNAKHDTTRCNILYELSETAGDDEWPAYNEQLKELAEKNVAIESPLRSFYMNKLGTAYNNVGFLKQQQGDITNALKFYVKGLKLREDVNDVDGIASSLNNIAEIYRNLGDISKALEYHHQSLKKREAYKDKQGIAISLNNIASIYEDQGELSKALEYYHKSLQMHEEIKGKQGMAIALNNIGLVYRNNGDIPKALEYLQRSLKLCEEINDKKGVASIYTNIGGIYADQGKIKDAMEFLNKSLLMNEEINEKKGISLSLNSIATALLKNKQTNEALPFAQKCLLISNQLGFPSNIKRAASTLKTIYQTQNKYKEAFEMYMLEVQMDDSINNQETKKASVKKQFQYEYEKQAAADSVKHAEEQKVKNAQLAAQSASLKQEQTQRYALYGGLVLVIAFSGFVFNRFRITQKQKKIIEEQKILVDTAYESLHEKNKEVMDSITYARRIQRALLTPEIYIDKALNKLNKS